MRRLCLFMFISIMSAGVAHASTVSSSIQAAWGFSDAGVSNGTVDEFIITGGIGESASTGVWNCNTKVKTNRTASKGVVAVVASKIVEHGGYFCPYQVQCDSKNSDKAKKVWLRWYEPRNFKSEKCMWLCDAGYAGIDCAPTNGAKCDSGTDFKTFLKGGISLRTNGKGCSTKIADVNAQIPYFWKDKEPEQGVVLGVTKFLTHGVIVAPVKIQCAKRNHERAWIDGLSLGDGQTRILCAEGYRPVNGDCEQDNTDVCKLKSIKWCDKFPADKYNSEIHILVTDNDCVKYICSDKTKAFASENDRSCTVDCIKDIRNGVDRNTGLCKTCKTGEYFNSNKNDCDGATGYTRQDLKYSKNNGTLLKPVKDQCWTKFDSDFEKCVTGK